MDHSEDRREIERVARIYLDGLYEGDTEKLAQAFHATSSLTFSDAGTLTATPRDAWFDAVRKRPSPKSLGLTRHDEILSIDVADGRTALVKLKCAIPPRYFTDYLSFLKIDGRWQIAQKTFAVETR